MLQRRSRLRHGVSLVETIIGIALMAMMLLALFSLVNTNLVLLFSSKAKSVGVALAQEKMEELKNLPYDSLATEYGTIYPAGTLKDEVVLTRNKLRFLVRTDIRYVDNPYDGDINGSIVGKPQDIYPYDYKKATITILSTDGKHQYAQYSSDIAAKTAETSGNTGVLIVRVINASGQPVEGASVIITNSTVSPGVNIQTQTDVQGQVIIPKLPPDAETDYHVVITKSGFSTDQTYAASLQLPDPANPDFGMVAQQTTIKTFSIDQLSNLDLTILNTSGAPIANTSITVSGQKVINTTPSISKYSQTLTTDNNGKISLSLIEWDSYAISVAGYTVLATSPYQPVTVAPGSNTTATITGALSPTSYPKIEQVTPLTTTATSGVLVDITGDNFNSGSTITLRKAGESDRVATGVVYTAPDLLSATFDLTGAATGAWDIVVTTSGRSTIQSSGITVQ